MKIEIDFNKKEIVLLEPTSLKDLNSRLGEIGVSDFKIVSKHTIQLVGNSLTNLKNNWNKVTPNSFPPQPTIMYNPYAFEGMSSTFGQRAEDC